MNHQRFAFVFPDEQCLQVSRLNEKLWEYEPVSIYSPDGNRGQAFKSHRDFERQEFQQSVFLPDSKDAQKTHKRVINETRIAVIDEHIAMLEAAKSQLERECAILSRR